MFRSIRRKISITIYESFSSVRSTESPKLSSIFFFFCFQHFSNSIRLSLLNYLSRILFAATVYETCASHVPFVRPAPTFFEIFYSIENGILIRALSFPSSSNCFYPSLGSFIFQRDGPSRLFNFTSSPLRTFVRKSNETKKRGGSWVGSMGRSKPWFRCERGLCTRINTETWSLELIPEPSKVHLETPATASPFL